MRYFLKVTTDSIFPKRWNLYLFYHYRLSVESGVAGLQAVDDHAVSGNSGGVFKPLPFGGFHLTLKEGGHLLTGGVEDFEFHCGVFRKLNSIFNLSRNGLG